MNFSIVQSGRSDAFLLLFLPYPYQIARLRYSSEPPQDCEHNTGRNWVFTSPALGADTCLFSAGAKLPCGGGEQGETEALGATRWDQGQRGCSWPSTQGQLGSCLGSKGSLQPGRRWVPEDSLASSGDCRQQSQQASSEPRATAGLWTSSAEHLKWVFNTPFACWAPQMGGDPGLLHSEGKLLAVGLLFVVRGLQEAAEHGLRATGAHLDQGKERGVKRVQDKSEARCYRSCRTWNFRG